MKNTYISYNVYEAPKSRTEAGTFICEFKDLTDAVGFVEDVKKNGFNFFIKGVKEDGTEVLFL